MAENGLVDAVNPFAELKSIHGRNIPPGFYVLVGAIWDHDDHVDCCVP